MDLSDPERIEAALCGLEAATQDCGSALSKATTSMKDLVQALRDFDFACFMQSIGY